MQYRVHRKRPCRICRRFFRANPRLGMRQKTCGRPACKQAWNRKLCAARRKREREREREDRLRDRLQDVPRESCGAEPMNALNNEALRHAIPLEYRVVLEEIARVLMEWARHSLPRQLAVQQSNFDRLLPGRARHSIRPQPTERQGKSDRLLPDPARHSMARPCTGG